MTSPSDQAAKKWTDEQRREYAARLQDADQDKGLYIEFWLKNKQERAKAYQAISDYRDSFKNDDHRFPHADPGEWDADAKLRRAALNGKLKHYADWLLKAITTEVPPGKPRDEDAKEIEAICPAVFDQINSARSRVEYLHLLCHQPEEKKKKILGVIPKKDKAYDAYWSRLRDMTNKHGADWVRCDLENRVPAGMEDWLTKAWTNGILTDGFVNQIHVDQQEWLRYGEHIVDSVPHVQVAIHDITDLPKVLAAPCLQKVRDLSLHKKGSHMFTKQDAADLASSPHLTHLTALSFSDHGLQEGAQGILDAAVINPLNSLYKMKIHGDWIKYGNRSPEEVAEAAEWRAEAEAKSQSTAIRTGLTDTSVTRIPER